MSLSDVKLKKLLIISNQSLSYRVDKESTENKFPILYPNGELIFSVFLRNSRKITSSFHLIGIMAKFV